MNGAFAERFFKIDTAAGKIEQPLPGLLENRGKTVIAGSSYKIDKIALPFKPKLGKRQVPAAGSFRTTGTRGIVP